MASSQLLVVVMVMVTGVFSQGTYTYAAYGEYDDYGTGGGVYENYDNTYDGEYEYGGTPEAPVFTSTSQSLTVEVGGDVTFPCHVDHLGDYVIILKKVTANGEHRFLFVGDHPLKGNRRIVKNGTDFTLRGARKVNAGQYVCRVEVSPAVELTHSLDVLYAPTVKLVTPPVQEVHEGANLTLECQADGNPSPEITWSSASGDLPPGATQEGGMLELEDVGIEEAGEYVCSGYNGISQPQTTTTATTRLHVLHPPQVTAFQRVEESQDEGHIGILECEVTGYPEPIVTWKKNDGAALPPTAHYRDVHTLEIRPLAAQDLGNYTCWAENDLDTVHDTVYLAGLLPAPQVTSGPIGAGARSFTLTWTTSPAFTPPVPAHTYRLRLKQIHDDEEEEEEEGEEKEERDEESVVYEEEDTEIKEAEENAAEEEWSEFLYPAAEAVKAEGEEGALSHTLEGLKPHTHYQVTVALENAFGWSPESQVLEFSTTPDTTTTTTTTVMPPREPLVLSGAAESRCGPLRSRVLRVVVTAVAVLVLGAVMC